MNTYLYDLVYILLHPGTITISRETISGGGGTTWGAAFAAAGPLGQAHGGALLHCALGPGGVLGLGFRGWRDLKMGNIGVLDGF